MGETVHVVDVVDDPLRDPRSIFHKVDILDMPSLESIMKGIDYVHHNAALVPLKKAGDKFWDVNVTGTRNVLTAAKKAGVRHLSHMSSSAVFGNLTDKDMPLSDDPPNLRPIEIYGESKWAGEQIIKEEMNNGTLSCSIIRPRTIIGTERLGIFQILFEWISEGRNIYIIGNGKNMFQFAHVEDLVYASIQSALQMKSGIFNIGTKNYGTLREGLEHLCLFAKTNAKVVSIPTWMAIPPLYILDKLGLSPLGPWHYLTYHKPYAFNTETAEKELGWKSRYSNNTMLTESYTWFMNNKENLKQQKESSKSAHRGGLKQGILGILKKIS